jgi:Holliday junction resolvase RusA-like endonuclease
MKTLKLEMTIPVLVLPKQSVELTKAGWRTKKETKANAARLRYEVRSRLRGNFQLFIGPVKASYVFSYPWRKDIPKKDRKDGPMPKDTAPDIDNLCKQMGDVLEKCGVFAQGDGQISEFGGVRKQWSNEAPRVWFRLEEV